MTDIYPFLALAAGIAIVIGMIIGARLNAFLALITAAMVVSLMAPGELAGKITRVAEAFGGAAANIGIVIAFAAVIGRCLMDSGAADRIVRAFLRALGEQRTSVALAGSGFVLSVPVFFDTVFYLLVPLARSLYQQTRRHYLKYVLAISAGAAATHTLVPPTPGPLLMATQLGIDVGTMMLAGALCALPATAAGLLYGAWLDRRMPVTIEPLTTNVGDHPAEAPTAKHAAELPGLFVSMLPIVLPIVMIASNTVVTHLAQRDGAADALIAVAQWTSVIGNANLALGLSAAVALLVYVRQCRPTREQAKGAIEQALMSGGLIILITAAGGAFGAMLKAAEIGPAIAALFATAGGYAGTGLLTLGFAISALLKLAQGSTTVAVITAAGMMSGMIEGADLPFNPVYLATAIGGGGLVGSWMNDSGFWIFSKMGGFTELETLKSWTPLLCILGGVAFIATIVLSWLLPLT